VGQLLLVRGRDREDVAGLAVEKQLIVDVESQVTSNLIHLRSAKASARRSDVAVLGSEARVLCGGERQEGVIGAGNRADCVVRMELMASLDLDPRFEDG